MRTTTLSEKEISYGERALPFTEALVYGIGMLLIVGGAAVLLFDFMVIFSPVIAVAALAYLAYRVFRRKGVRADGAAS